MVQIVILRTSDAGFLVIIGMYLPPAPDEHSAAALSFALDHARNAINCGHHLVVTGDLNPMHKGNLAALQTLTGLGLVDMGVEFKQPDVPTHGDGNRDDDDDDDAGVGAAADADPAHGESRRTSAYFTDHHAVAIRTKWHELFDCDLTKRVSEALVTISRCHRTNARNPVQLLSGPLAGSPSDGRSAVPAPVALLDAGKKLTIRTKRARAYGEA
ncbi:hypothetical protein BC828DRAFT_404306 [Blastocladiella britannica]|nr:hypothetical protein BC828DRAFT_404306 [Blastocladiella britannica]